jgi:proline racemase
MPPLTPVLSLIDAHTGGEPARLVLGGLPPIPGATMAAKKASFQAHLDHRRTLLMQEPRGHKDMFGVVLTEPTTPDADYGALFIDSAGAIDMCGHGLMALTTALIELGLVAAVAPDTTLRFDTPAGRVEARAQIHGERVSAVSLTNVPAFVLERDVAIRVAGVGKVRVDVVFGGNFFALVPASALGVTVAPEHSRQLIALGMAVKEAINATLAIAHPEWEHIQQVGLTKIYEPPDPTQPITKNVVIFGAGQLDRSPCGTGTSAAMALAHAKGELPLGVEHISEGILGTRFHGHLEREVSIGGLRAVVPVVTGEAYLTGKVDVLLDPRDPFPYGFLLDAP